MLCTPLHVILCTTSIVMGVVVSLLYPTTPLYVIIFTTTIVMGGGVCIPSLPYRVQLLNSNGGFVSLLYTMGCNYLIVMKGMYPNFTL